MFSINLYSQTGLFIGPSIGDYNEKFIRVQFDQQYKWIRQEYSLQVDYKGRLVGQAKMGFGIYTKRWDVYGYLPFMNFEIFNERYNTPMGVEFFFKKRKYSKKWYDQSWFPYLSMNFDIYKDKFLPILRIKYKVL